jgi:hypothetical protein
MGPCYTPLCGSVSLWPTRLCVHSWLRKIPQNPNKIAKIQVNPTKSNLFFILTPKFWLLVGTTHPKEWGGLPNGYDKVHKVTPHTS